jgi:hypothetical protein
MAVLDFSAFGDDAAARNAAFAAAGPQDEIDGGWIPPDRRDADHTAAAAAIQMQTPPMFIAGRSVNANVTKACLWDTWEVAFKKKWYGVRQYTGSCVGAAGGNMLFSLAAADIVKRRDPGRQVVPFWLLPYGISRMLAGFTRRGEGSSGTTFAKAVGEYGHLDAEAAGLPRFNTEDGYGWGSAVELDWSVGRNIESSYLTAAKNNLVRSRALCRSTDDVRDALQNYYAITCASDWGGAARPPVKGTQFPVLLNKRTTTWQHQMSVQAWWDHPELGEIFYLLNQWGLDFHGRCPSGAPPGGFWIAKPDMAYIVRQQETYAFSELDDFPAVEVPLDFSAF